MDGVDLKGKWSEYPSGAGKGIKVFTEDYRKAQQDLPEGGQGCCAFLVAYANSEKIYSYPMYLESIITTGEVRVDLRKKIWYNCSEYEKL